MPHKKNPIGSENICGLARVIKGYAAMALDDNALWHERDISHSSVERIIAPDATTLIDYMLRRLGDIIDNLIVHEDKMYEDIFMTHGVIFSGRFVNRLVEKGSSREEAYDLIQPLALRAYNEKKAFKDLILASEVMKYLSLDDVDDCFDVMYHLRNVDLIFRRVGLLDQ